MRAGVEALPGQYFDVVLDGSGIIERPMESYDRQQMSNVSFLIGSNRDEWYMYHDPDMAWKDIDQRLDDIAPEYAAVLKSKVNGETDIRRAFVRLKSAHDMHCPVRYVASNINAVGGNSWVYYFTRQRPGPEMKNSAPTTARKSVMCLTPMKNGSRPTRWMIG